MSDEVSRAARIAADLDRIEALALGRRMHCEHYMPPPSMKRHCHAATFEGCSYCRRPICPAHQVAHRAAKHHASDLTAREAIGRVIWNASHLAALRVALLARTPLHDVITWAENASREVNERGR